MKWFDVEDIAESLEELFPEEDLLRIRFTDLKKKVIALDGFHDNVDNCNEKVLEAIQASWIELRNE